MIKFYYLRHCQTQKAFCVQIWGWKWMVCAFVFNWFPFCVRIILTSSFWKPFSKYWLSLISAVIVFKCSWLLLSRTVQCVRSRCPSAWPCPMMPSCLVAWHRDAGRCPSARPPSRRFYWCTGWSWPYWISYLLTGIHSEIHDKLLFRCYQETDPVYCGSTISS